MARLTKRIVDAAATEGSGWTWLGDDEVPGFGVIIYSSGTRTFALRYRTRSGRQRMMKFGQYGELTVQEARDMARKEKVRVLEGEDPRAEREREEAGVRTVGDLADRWVEDHAKPHRKTWQEDKRRVEGRIRLRPLILPGQLLQGRHEGLRDKHPAKGSKMSVFVRDLIERRLHRGTLPALREISATICSPACRDWGPYWNPIAFHSSQPPL
jgi:hypothetical protein